MREYRRSIVPLLNPKEVAALLLERDAAVSETDNYGWTPLHYAIIYGQEEVQALLLERGATASERTKDGRTALHLAVEDGREEVAARLLERGAAVNEVDSYGRTVLHLAAEAGREQVVALLLERGAAMNERANDGRTALHLAAEGGHEEVAALLLEHGAAVNEKDVCCGRTALHYAAEAGRDKVVALLLEWGAAAIERDSRGRTALDLAISGTSPAMSRVKVVTLLEVYRELRTGLHVAALGGNLSKVTEFLAQGAAVDERTNDGRTALHLAAQGGHEEVAALLLERGAAVSERNNEGKTPLHFAVAGCAESKDPTLVKLLVQRGAWALEQDNAASSAVDLADMLDSPQCAPPAPGFGDNFKRQPGRFSVMLLVSAMAAVATCAAPAVFIRVCTRCPAIVGRTFNFAGQTPSAESSRWAVGAQLLASTKQFSEGRRLLARAYRVSEVLVNCVIPMAAMLVVEPTLWLCFLAVAHALPILCRGGVPGMWAALREPYILVASAQESMLLSGAWKPGTYAALRWAYFRNVLIPFACLGFWISGLSNPLGINAVWRWYEDSEKGSNRLCTNFSTEHCLPGPQIGILYIFLGCALAVLGSITHLLRGLYMCMCDSYGRGALHRREAADAVSLAQNVAAAVLLAHDTADVTQAGLKTLNGEAHPKVQVLASRRRVL